MGLLSKFKAGLAKTHNKLVHEIKRIVTRSPKLSGESLEATGRVEVIRYAQPTFENDQWYPDLVRLETHAPAPLAEIRHTPASHSPSFAQAVRQRPNAQLPPAQASPARHVAYRVALGIQDAKTEVAKLAALPGKQQLLGQVVGTLAPLSFSSSAARRRAELIRSA